MIGRMKSMEAMKPLRMFMTVLKMYTKECLHGRASSQGLVVILGTSGTLCTVVTAGVQSWVHPMVCRRGQTYSPPRSTSTSPNRIHQDIHVFVDAAFTASSLSLADYLSGKLAWGQT